MPGTINMRTILIQDGTHLPDTLHVESEPCATDWRLVKDPEGCEFGRKIRDAGWAFFCLTGDVKATVWGSNRQKAVRGAVKRILSNLKSEKFNALEITQVSVKRFLGLPYTSVTARSRHIQESSTIFQVNEIAERDRTRSAAA